MKEAFPILTVRNLTESRRFYERLGFVQKYQFPEEGEPAFVTLERAGAVLGIALRDSAAAEAFGYWVYVDDVDMTLDALRAEGAAIVEEPQDQPWGERVARARDPDGNLLILGAKL